MQQFARSRSLGQTPNAGANRTAHRGPWTDIVVHCRGCYASRRNGFDLRRGGGWGQGFLGLHAPQYNVKSAFLHRDCRTKPLCPTICASQSLPYEPLAQACIINGLEMYHDIPQMSAGILPETRKLRVGIQAIDGQLLC